MERIMLGIALASAPLAAQAQGLRIQRIQGGVELGAEAALQDTQSPGAPKREFDRFRFLETIDLSLDGFFLTPELVAFRTGGRFGLRQERLDVSGAPERGELDENPFDYDVLLNVLRSKPVSLLGFASRAENDVVQNFGTDTETRSEVVGSTLHLRLPLLPSSITWQSTDTESESTSGLFLSRRAETRRLLQYSGNHFSETTQLSLRLRDEDVDDASLPPVGDYRIRQADGVFGYRWGDYFEKSWRASARRLERTGNFELDSTSASSAFLWDVTETFRTQLHYDFDRFDSQGQRTTTSSGFLSFRHQLYESLTTSLGLSADNADRTGSERTTYGGDLAFDYRKRLPADSRLLLDLRLRRRIEDSNVEDSQAAVSGEQLPIGDLTGNFLANERVDLTSIVVFDGLGGTPLVEGLDYVVTVIGQQVSIDPLPGGSIGLGDTVFVDYLFTLDPSARIADTAWGLGAGWEKGGFRVSYRHDERDERLLSGETPPTLRDGRRDSYRVEYRGERGGLRHATVLLYRQDRFGSIDFDELTLRHSLGWSPSRAWEVNFNAVTTFRDFFDPDRETDTLTVNLTATWRPNAQRSARLFADFRQLDDSESFDQDDWRFGIRADLGFGKLEVTPALIWTLRERGGSETQDLRAILRLRRSF